jgi:tetratricopeptide (TPR) repeat protein
MFGEMRAFHLVQLVTIPRRLNATIEIAALHLNMGELYLSKLNPDKALVEFKTVLNKGASGRDRILETWALTGIGKSYKLKKDYQNAIDNYLHGLRVCREINKFEEEVKIKDELANTYLETWDLTKASAYADSALSLAEGQHFISLLSKANATLGNVYLHQNKFELAISYILKALEIAKQTNNLEGIRDAQEALSSAYKQSGQFEKALKANEQFHEMKDSLNSIDKNNEFIRKDLSIKYENDKAMDSVKSQIAFQKKIVRQQVLTYSGFTALVLVILLAFFMYRSYVTQKKYNELLAVEKKRHLAHIEAQSNILSDIADTQAHQIRGPISTILGLVHIFNYEDPTDPMNKQVMEWITSTTEKLDAVVKDVIIKENQLRDEHDEEEKGANK